MHTTLVHTTPTSTQLLSILSMKCVSLTQPVNCFNKHIHKHTYTHTHSHSHCRMFWVNISFSISIFLYFVFLFNLGVVLSLCLFTGCTFINCCTFLFFGFSFFFFATKQASKYIYNKSTRCALCIKCVLDAANTWESPTDRPTTFFISTYFKRF